jgi:hypothetical protein
MEMLPAFTKGSKSGIPRSGIPFSRIARRKASSCCSNILSKKWKIINSFKVSEIFLKSPIHWVQGALSVKVTDHLGDLDVDERIILKLILNK